MIEGFVLMENITYVVLGFLIFATALYVLKKGFVRRENDKVVTTHIVSNPVYDDCEDAFTCLMRTDGGTTLCFRGGGVTGYPRGKRDT